MTTEAVTIGAAVKILVRGTEIGRGTVVKIEEPPRKLTGGRGIAVRSVDGQYFDGYDADDLWPVLSLRIW